MNKKDMIFWLIVLVSIPFIIKGVFWLINDYQISPLLVTALIVYVVIVYPQYTAMHALKLVNAMNNDEELSSVRADKSNWLLFVNDFNLSSYYGTDTVLKLINSILLRISIPVIILSVLYINLLVVFIDLGPQFTTFMMYAMLISIAVYLVTKTIMVMYLINMFKGIMVSIAGIAHPIGFMIITWSVKHYFNSLETVRHEETMGVSYE